MRSILITACMLGSLVAGAQQLRVVNATGAPVTAVRVKLLKDRKESIFVTDDKGTVTLPPDGYPYTISIAPFNYEATADTITAAWSKVMVLQPKVQNMNEVVVSGQYAPKSRDNAVQKIEIIDRKKIDAMAAQNLRDVLTNQLNIRLSQDPIFGTSLSMQGSKSYGENTKILIDGVPIIGKQNGSLDLAQINLANIERIEIIEGPMSVSYGTDALAGTINLITKKTQKHELEAGATTYYETIGTYNVLARVGFHKGRHTVQLNGGRNFFAGWSPGDNATFFDFKKELADTGRVKLWKPREQYMSTLQYLYTWNKTTLSYKLNYFDEVITNRGMPQLPYLEMAFDDYYHTYRTDNVLNVSSTLKNGMNINAFVAHNAYKRIKRRYANDLTTLEETPTPGDQDTSKYNEINSRGSLTTMYQDKKCNFEAGYDISIQDANSTQLLDRKQNMADYAVFASAEYKPVSNFTIRPGLRYGYNTRYSVPLVPSVNLMYKVSKDLTVRGSYAKGFRRPNLKELYFDFVDINHDIHGNPELKAEYSDNYSVSGVYSGKAGDVGYRINGSVFYNDIKDLISLAMVVGGRVNEYSYVNIGRYKTDGAQLSAEINYKQLAVTVGGTYVGTYNELSETEDVPQFSYSPELRTNVSYNFKKQHVTVSVFYKYTGRFLTYMADAATNKAIPTFMSAYQTADITASKSLFGNRLVVGAGCKNLFNVTTVAANQTNTGAHSGGGTAASVGTGRYYFVKLDVNLHN